MKTVELREWAVAGEQVLADWQSRKSAPWYIYGCGILGKRIYEGLKYSGFNVSGFVDTFKKGSFSPESKTKVIGLDEVPTGGIIAIAVVNPVFNIRDIESEIRKSGHGFLNTQLAVLLAGITPYYWMTNSTDYRDSWDNIIESSSFFTDEISKNIYDRIWKSRLCYDFDAFLDAMPNQYFPSDMERWIDPIRLIDCGSFDGDVPEAAKRLGYTIKSLCAFEPDSMNYANLTNNMRNLLSDSEISLFPCGVADSLRQFNFVGGHAQTSAVSELGGTMIQCVAIDEAVPNFHPNLIKMDVEGMESAAIEGAKNTIIHDKPGLAISTYHRPHDLWQLPLQLSKLRSDYSFSLRMHAHSGFETVLYAR